MSACTQAPLSPAPQITLQECQAVTRCTLPAMAPTTNGQLDDALHMVKAAWAQCAAKVDMIFDCQTRSAHDAAPTHAAATHD
ncbi:Rz1-like lysis system protein LysC [Paraburkholderia bryophila]|uniref:Rz1-like lysis system protein LysC n=1 Tax=Paraburkholderia bryophila TaxID=420952 RepID=UPI001FC9893C|nr:Rz1-like lysis system protein LysC [Paraburkholderia bryophila]